MRPAPPVPHGRLEELLRASIEGDDVAYREFLQEVARIMRAFAWRRAPARASGFDPEDLVQEILIAVHGKRHTWVSSQSVAPWLYAIAPHKAVDAYRRHGSRIEVDINDFAHVLESPQVEETASPREVDAAIESLKGRQREVVSALSVEGRSVRETAKKLGVSEVAVRVAFHRGLEAISARFGVK